LICVTEVGRIIWCECCDVMMWILWEPRWNI